jgi:hypothetical protein
LRDEAVEAVDRLIDVGTGAAPGRAVGGLPVEQGEMRLQDRHRRAQLVGRVRGEPAQHRHRAVHPLQEVVERGHERHRLARHAGDREGRDRAGALQVATLHLAAQPVERRQPHPHGEPDQQAADPGERRAERRQRRQHAPGEQVASDRCLGDLDQRGVPRDVDRLQHHADAHPLPAVDGVAVGDGLGARQGVGQGQVGVAGHQGAVVGDAVVDAVVLGIRQHSQGRGRHVQGDGVVLHRQALGDRQDGAGEHAVVGVGHEGIDEPRAADRQDHREPGHRHEQEGRDADPQRVQHPPMPHGPVPVRDGSIT